MKKWDERARVKDAIVNFIGVWGMGTYTADKRGRMVGAELSELDLDTATAAEIKEIIGVGWADQLTCDECGKESWDIIQIGEKPDYDSRTAWICGECLTTAAEMAGQKPKLLSDEALIALIQERLISMPTGEERTAFLSAIDFCPDCGTKNGGSQCYCRCELDETDDPS